jgi:hypothetical protein
MKRWIIVATVLGVLLTATAAVLASPTNVGGNFSVLTSESKDIGPAVYKGNGNPQGVPFQAAEISLLLAPTNVGGN